MNTLIQHMENSSVTENGGKAYKSTLNKCLDFFYLAGNLSSLETSQEAFDEAMEEDPTTALLVLLWSRGIINGAGVKNLFRSKIGDRLDILIPMIKDGEASWKDFFTLFNAALENGDKSRYAYADIVHQEIRAYTDRLFFKWFPRSGRVWQYVYKTYGAKTLREIIVSGTDVVETLMSKGQWSAIKYETVPSRAMAIYGKNAYHQHDDERFSMFLINKTAKINSARLFPHEVVKMSTTDLALAEKQWAHLPNYIGENMSFLPIVDASGSMSIPAYSKITLLDIAIGLGIYLSEKNKSEFKDKVILFSNKSKWLHLKGSLRDKYMQIEDAAEMVNTNLATVFEQILSTCVQHNIPQSDLPSHLLILTDGQFDKMCNGADVTIFEKYSKDFEEKGYTLPKVVFWNLAAYKNFPAVDKQRNVLLLSGYTANSLMDLLGGVTPLDGMLRAVEKFSKYINPS